jgi:hypothetical protein
MRRLILAAVLAFAANACAVERVLEFHSDIRIEANGELVVTERIAVEAEGRDIRRGILRDFPTQYHHRDGSAVNVPFSVLQVSRDGVPEPFAFEAVGNGLRIRIGNVNVLLPRGRHEYQITYRTGRQVGFFAEHDELYWNVNGNGWTFPFDALTARVTLPSRVAADRIRVEGYTGFFGARGRDYRAQAENGGASFAATRPLARGEGLTIVVGFPKGLVHQPTRRERLGWFMRDNHGSVAGVVGFLVLLGFLWWRWSLVGKDPREGPQFPRYEPPPGVGPAGARYIDQMRFDDRCFAALLVGLGQRGAVRIKARRSDYDLVRSGTPSLWLPGEKTLLDSLLPKPDAGITIGNFYDPAVLDARKKVESVITTHFGDKLFSKNYGSLVAGWIVAAIVVLLMVNYSAPFWHIAGIAVAMLVTLALFKIWLPAYSVEGRKLEDAIVGLRQYLSVAEADDLRRMKAPPQTKEEFAKLLPYAVALGVEKTWADRFAKTLGAAAVAAAVADYYSSDSGGGLFSRDGMSSFTSGLTSMGETVSSASTPPGSSSGFSSDSSGGSSDSGGGGGSSGGGGGGGGGSGW